MYRDNVVHVGPTMKYREKNIKIKQKGKKEKEKRKRKEKKVL